MTEYSITKLGEDCIANGSEEYNLYEFVKANGPIPIADLMVFKKTYFKIFIYLEEIKIETMQSGKRRNGFM